MPLSIYTNIGRSGYTIVNNRIVVVVAVVVAAILGIVAFWVLKKRK